MRLGLLGTLVPVVALAACESNTLAPADATAASPQLSNAAVASTQASSYPVDLLVFVPCAAGGAGETIQVSGTVKDLFHITLNAGGHLSVMVEDNPQGVSGYGLTTGTQYQATGVTRSSFTTAFGSTQAYTNNFRMISAGSGGNFMIQENAHVTVNANGEFTAYMGTFSTTCQ
jgi:hypothetical protein